MSEAALSEARGTISFDIGSEDWDVNEAGTILYRGSPAGGYLQSVRRFTIVESSTGVADELGDYPDFARVSHPTAPLFFLDWFSPAAHAALAPPPYRVSIASADEWEVRFFNDRRELVRILRPSLSRLPFTPEVRTGRRENFEEIATRFRAPAGSAGSIADDLATPDSLPAIAQLIWDRAGNLWTARREVNPADRERYEGFDREGRWISSVLFARSLGNVLEIGDDYILSAWHDELSVPYLRQHQIHKEHR